MNATLGAAALALAVGALRSASPVATVRRPRAAASWAIIEASARLEARLEVQSAELRRLADAAGTRDLASEQLRSGLDGARRVLSELNVREQERRGDRGEHREVVKRLSTVLAGGASKGRGGENVLREHLSQLPPGMLDQRLPRGRQGRGVRAAPARRTPPADRFQVDGARRARSPRGRRRCRRPATPALARSRRRSSGAPARWRSTSIRRSRRRSRSRPCPMPRSRSCDARMPTRSATGS